MNFDAERARAYIAAGVRLLLISGEEQPAATVAAIAGREIASWCAKARTTEEVEAGLIADLVDLDHEERARAARRNAVAEAEHASGIYQRHIHGQGRRRDV